MSPSVPLPRVALSSALELLLEAFFDNPAHVYIAPDESTRGARLEWLFARNLGVQTEIGRSFCRLDESDPTRIEAMAFWHAPGVEGMKLGTMARHGLLLAPFQLGLGGFRRLLETTSAIDGQCARDAGGERHWLLNNMIVRRERQGSGVGTEVLGEQLRAVIDPSGCPALLATQRPENVTFYTRLGFTVTSEASVGRGTHAFSSWVMRYDA